MKIERIIFGMQTGNGKIDMLKTSGVPFNFKQIESIKKLTPADSGKYLWYRDEQMIAYPIVKEVADKDPKHGGRTFVQNQTFLVNIHEFLTYSMGGRNPFEAIKTLLVDEYETFPVYLDPVYV